METLLNVGLGNAVGAAMLALLVGAIGIFCRRPAVMHALWLLVLVKLITPRLWSIPIALPASQASQPEAETAALLPMPLATQVMEPLEPVFPTPMQIEPAIPREPASTPVVAPAAEQLIPMPAEAPTAQPETIITPPVWIWVEAIFFLWLGGAFLYWLVAGVRVMRFHRAMQSLSPASDELQERAKTLADRLGLKTAPLVFLLDAPISPMVWAFGRRPRLLLPKELWQTLTDAQRDLLLTHELAHLRRRDHWVRVLDLLVVGLYWWLPVAWWARLRLQEAAESCCDACVLSVFPESAPDYASTLVDSAAFLSGKSSPLPVGASGIGHVHLMRRRLTMILKGRIPSGLSWAGIGLLLIAATVVLPMWPTLNQLSAEAPEPEQAQGDEAQKAFHLAQVHEKMEQPGSAYFFYEIVKHKHAGTQWAEKAAKKLTELKHKVAKLDETKPEQASKEKYIEHAPIAMRFTLSQCLTCHPGISESALRQAHGFPPIADQHSQQGHSHPGQGGVGLSGKPAEQQPPPPPPPVKANVKEIADLRDEIELLKVKLEMERARLELAETEKELAQQRKAAVEQAFNKGVIGKEQMLNTQQELATRHGAYKIQLGQFLYVEMQLKQAIHRLDLLNHAPGQPLPRLTVQDVGLAHMKKLIDDLTQENQALKKQLDELKKKSKGKSPVLMATIPALGELATTTRILAIPYICEVVGEKGDNGEVSEDEKSVRVLLSVSRDEGRTWTVVSEGKPGKGQLSYKAQENGLYLLKLEVEVQLDKWNRQLLDPTAGNPKHVPIRVRVNADPDHDPDIAMPLLPGPIELKLTFTAN